MAEINKAKVLVGGIVAGVVMTISQFVLNEYVLADAMTETFAAMNVEPPGGMAIMVFIVISFVAAIMTMKLYAVLRDRCGVGPKTAMCAGLFVWFLYYAAPTISWAVLGLMPQGTTVMTLIWTCVEMMVAATAGAYFYSD